MRLSLSMACCWRAAVDLYFEVALESGNLRYFDPEFTSPPAPFRITNRSAPAGHSIPFHKRYRGGGVPRISVHFLNDRPRSVEKLNAKLHRQRPRRRSTSASKSGSAISGGGGSRAIIIRLAVSSPTAWPVRLATTSATRRH